MTIDWEAPPSRRGAAGTLDRLVGPGATRAELGLQLAVPVVAAIAAPLHAARVVDGWSWLQYVACAVLAFDVAGGVVTNATSSAKRWYHRDGQGFPHHFAFVALHLLHLLVVSWLYLGLDVAWLAIAGTGLLVSAVVILSVPQYLQRPVALVAYSGALLISMYVLAPPAGLEWFLPLFYLKLLVSHLPREEPYRPLPDVRGRP